MQEHAGEERPWTGKRDSSQSQAVPLTGTHRGHGGTWPR